VRDNQCAAGVSFDCVYSDSAGRAGTGMGSEDRQGQAWWSGSSGSSGWAGELCSGCKYTKRRGPACTDSAQGLGETLLRTVHFPARPSVWLAAESGRSGHGRFSCRRAWQRNCFNGTRRAGGRAGGQAGRRVGASRATRRMTTMTRAGAVKGSKGQRCVQQRAGGCWPHGAEGVRRGHGRLQSMRMGDLLH
jgi:hypothetical protein